VGSRPQTPNFVKGDGARRIAVFIALNVLAIAAYVLVAINTGFFSHISYSLFWSPDSHGYRDVGHWLLGAASNPLESQHRPFLYPLLLGLAEKIGGAPGIWIINLVCWFGMVNVTAAATLRMTGRLTIAAIVFLVLATNASLIVLSFQALTETLTAFLESLWILGLALSRLPPTRPRETAMILFPIALLTVVKPEYQIQLLIALVLLAITIWRLPKGRAALAVTAAACCLPVAFQLGLMATANHMLSVSDSGQVEFKSYYVSQVYATINGLPDDLVAARVEVGRLSDRQALTFLLDHPRTAVDTLVSNLHRNLTSGSNFVDPAQYPLLADVIRNTNRLYLKLHAVFLPIVLLALWRRRDLRLLLLYLFAGLVTLLPSLIVDQGDRYVEMAVPLWAAAYGLAVADLLPDVSHALERFQGRVHAT
jgi:hypothetical protein